MNNQPIQLRVKKLNTKTEWEQFCLDDLVFNKYINELKDEVSQLREDAITERLEPSGMGMPMEKPSDLLASYINSEIDRLTDLRYFFKKESPNPGYKWEYKNYDNAWVNRILDLDNATDQHPVYLSWLGKHKNKYFSDWLHLVSNVSINNTFKLAYFFKMQDLIPKKIKLKKLK